MSIGSRLWSQWGRHRIVSRFGARLPSLVPVAVSSALSCNAHTSSMVESSPHLCLPPSLVIFLTLPPSSSCSRVAPGIPLFRPWPHSSSLASTFLALRVRQDTRRRFFGCCLHSCRTALLRCRCVVVLSLFAPSFRLPCLSLVRLLAVCVYATGGDIASSCQTQVADSVMDSGVVRS